MRRTVREDYVDSLKRALKELRAINTRFEQRGDLMEAKDELLEWQQDIADMLEHYLGPDDAAGFRDHYNFDLVGMNGQYLSTGIEQYDEMLSHFLQNASTTNITRGYADDVRVPLERIDELLDQLGDLWRRAHGNEFATAADGLRRWKERAHAVIASTLGKDEASEFYGKHAGKSWGNPEGTYEEQFKMYIEYLWDLKEEIQKYPHHVIAPAEPTSATKKNATAQNRKVFVVHGHGHLKDAVARVIEKLKLEAIILDEKPGAGNTLIEKFEKYADVGYAVVLLAPDDVGGKAGEAMHDRARQNVIFELAYFVGKIGRGRVCLLYVEGVEIPSDYFGVEYVPFDSKSSWKYKLAGELREAGYTIDFNLLT
jgi:predicted nucleotide-binding protein